MKITLIVAFIIIIVMIAFFFIMPRGANIKDFEYLRTPQIIEKTNQKMIVAETVGDPSQNAVKAIKLLFSSYYKIKDVPKSLKIPAIRARWPFDVQEDKAKWIGYFALPVPESVKNLPKVKNPDSLKIYLQNWEYGTVAEILHVGSYETETKTIETLKEFIKNQGYQIIGLHEEEYLKGPEMFSKGNPDKYLTIIRYRIKLIK